ncbi:MAG: conjugal transfer protein TrbC [Ferrovum myxofaciens]|jgi:type IV secretion system protein VirB2|uniref:TrbC/VirB2 family protein n=1 Tax=Ferrovum myxofaciens TaxID=416213 RepID=UPI0023522759|nr:TrbC/VirB2 family protein [Ferrovum myxofaciens]QKE39987.1 MAG: conjugal transfer protein TrbC [Ferrovum myxofaciens]
MKNSIRNTVCNPIVRRAGMTGAVFLATISNAFATGAGGLPWDGAIMTLQSDLTGPVATAISVIAFLAAGAALVFGEELGGIAKKALYVVLGVAFIVLGDRFLAAMGLTGTLIY